MLFANLCKAIKRVIRVFVQTAKLAMLSNLEYRFNFILDACVQPIISTSIDIMFWTSLFTLMGKDSFAGYGLKSYLGYLLWATFFSRISSNWMYEFRMIREIESGAINSILTRPFTFYEFYCGQFLGYKFLTAGVSFLIPLCIGFWWDFSIQHERLPFVLIMLVYNLFFIYSMSFLVSSLGFLFTKVNALTYSKNLILFLLSGEMFPLDLFPENVKNILIHLPFAAGCYIPVGYLTGRVSNDLFFSTFLSITIGMIAVMGVAILIWRAGVQRYSGTGA